MAVGHALRNAREARGLTLEYIAGETHIPRHFLESLERDEFEELPAPVYVRGFIRAYASFLRMSAALLIDQLPDPWRQPSTTAPVVSPPLRRRKREPEPDSWLTDWDAAPAVHRGHPDAPPPPPMIPAPEVEALPPLEPKAAPTMRAAVRSSAPAPTLIDDFDFDGDAEPAAPASRESQRRGGGRLLLAVVGGLAAMASLVVAGALVLGGGGNGSTPAGGAGDDPTTNPATVATDAPSQTVTVTEVPASMTPEPTQEPSPTPAPPSPTPTVAAAVTAVPPASAFAYCDSLGGGNYSCGPSPWRVICAPSGPFFDPGGVIPRPIPEAWTGWSETTLTGRLENIWTAC